MKSKRLIPFIILAAAALTGRLSAQQLVWTPVNPSFGGNPYNATWMLSEMQAENDITESKQQTSGSYSTDPLKDFQNNLNRSLLSQLSRSLVAKSFGEQGLKDGRYDMGNYVIDVATTNDGIEIKILDAGTGSETSILVPFY